MFQYYKPHLYPYKNLNINSSIKAKSIILKQCTRYKIHEKEDTDNKKTYRMQKD